MIRTQLTTVFLIATFALALPALLRAQLNVADPGTKTIEFTGDFVFLSEAPVETIEGTLAGATGHVSTDLSYLSTDLSKTRGTISVPVVGMKTGNKKRDKHVVSKAWLDAESFPEIEFEITRVEVAKVEDSAEVKVAHLDATGQFSLHGVSREMTIPVVLKWKGNSLKVSADFVVSLGDFDIEGAKGIIGERVGESIQLSANLTGSAH